MGARSTQQRVQLIPGKSYIGGTLTLDGTDQNLTDFSHYVLSVLIRNIDPDDPTTDNSAVTIKEPYGNRACMVLTAGDPVTIDVDDPSIIIVNGTADDVICWLAPTAS